MKTNNYTAKVILLLYYLNLCCNIADSGKLSDAKRLDDNEDSDFEKIINKIFNEASFSFGDDEVADDDNYNTIKNYLQALDGIMKKDDKSALWPFVETAPECSFPAHLFNRKDKNNGKEYSDEDLGLNAKDYGLNKFSQNSKTDQSELEKLSKGRNTQKEAVESTRIVGGTSFAPGKWPWLVSIGFKDMNSPGHWCTGSLINKQWVVSAAHCFHPSIRPCAYNVRLGTYNWLNDADGHHVDRDVISIHNHPLYDGTSKVHDIALVKLSEPVDTNKNSYINSIRLATTKEFAVLGTVCFAAGWGEREVKIPVEPKADSNLQDALEVDLPLITYTYGSNQKPCGKYGDLSTGAMCVGYEEGGKDTCQGDSGGPLMVKKDDGWYLFGVTSWGDGCAAPGYPGIYTDVGFHIDFIRETIGENLE